MKKLKHPVLILLLVVAVVFGAVVAVTVAMTVNNSRNTVSLDEGWVMETSDGVTEEISFRKALEQTRGMGAGSVVTFRRHLDDMGHPVFPTIYLRTDRSAVQVFLDDELIYEGEMDRVEEGNFVGRRVRMVMLPADYTDKELSVVFYISRRGSSRGDDTPRFGSYEACQTYYIQRLTPAIAVGVGILIFGFVFLFITLFFVASTPGQAPEVISSITCIVMGIWVIGFFDATRLYVSDAHTTAVEYAALYLMLPLLWLWLGYVYRQVRWLRIAGLAGLLVVLLMIVLHAVSNVHIDSWIIVYLVISLITFTTTLVVVGRRRRRSTGELDLTVQETGVMILTASMLLYLIVYSLQSFALLPESMVSMYIPVIGIVCFVVAQIVYYFIHVSEAYARRQEFSALSHLAYVDVLTGLPNRKAAMHVFEQLDLSGDEYAIVSLDINGLKSVNDRYGHHEGDRLLIETARALNECFAEVGFRARLSGDEYLVTIRRADRADVEARLKRLHRWFADLSAPGRLNVSIACGVAYVHEEEHDTAEKVFRRADERMYEDKRRFYEGKVANGDRLR